MARIHFSSGESFEFDSPVSVYEAASSLGIISREVITAKVNGNLCELSTKIDSDAEVTLLTFKDPEGKQVFRHTAAHVMAQAVKRLYPETKQTIGPATENGYFQDFDAPVSFTPDILKNIEAEMKKIVKENLLIERSVISRAEAIKLMTELNEPYKVERMLKFLSTSRANTSTFAPALIFTPQVLLRLSSLHSAQVRTTRATRTTRCSREFTVLLIPTRMR